MGQSRAAGGDSIVAQEQLMNVHVFIRDLDSVEGVHQEQHVYRRHSATAYRDEEFISVLFLSCSFLFFPCFFFLFAFCLWAFVFLFCVFANDLIRTPWAFDFSLALLFFGSSPVSIRPSRRPWAVWWGITCPLSSSYSCRIP